MPLIVFDEPDTMLDTVAQKQESHKFNTEIAYN